MAELDRQRTGPKNHPLPIRLLVNAIVSLDQRADLPSVIPANLANPQQILPEKNSLCPPGIQPLQLTRTAHRFQSSHPKIVCQLVPMLMLLCTAIGIGFRQPCGYP